MIRESLYLAICLVLLVAFAVTPDQVLLVTQ